MTAGRMPADALGRRSTVHLLLIALVLSGCGAGREPDPVAAADSERTPAQPLEPNAPPAEEPAAEPPAPAPYPDDWYDRALAVAEAARPAVVAIGWTPEELPMGRLETGFLVSPDLVVTSAVVGQAGESNRLQVRLIDGTFRDASVLHRSGEQWMGVALLQLDSPVDAPTLELAEDTDLVLGAPLLAIGHPNVAYAEGGWLVTVGPVTSANRSEVWADIVAPATGDGFFDGGSSGAPLINLDGRVVGLVCCNREWGPAPTYETAFVSEVLLRRHIVHDLREWHGGPSAAAIRAQLGELLP
jgi:S1-C subfamily serine protease